MKDKTFYLRLKGSYSIFLEKPTLILHQYFFYGDPRFSAEFKPTFSNHLLTILLTIKRIESALFRET